MTTQVLFFADSESMKMLMLQTKEDRLNYIEGIHDYELKNSLIKQYNILFGNHENDHIRNVFSFLNDYTMEDTLSFYDKLSDKLRSDLIYAIGFDHNHLHEMIAVHNYFLDAEFPD